MGVFFALVFQLAHVVDKAEFPQTDENGKLPYEWAEHQLATTVDFATNSKWATWLLGGLNFQVEHHLFPRISHVHYPAIHKIVKKVCAEKNVTHREYSTMWQAIIGHGNHLKEMGKLNSSCEHELSRLS